MGDGQGRTATVGVGCWVKVDRHLCSRVVCAGEMCAVGEGCERMRLGIKHDGTPSSLACNGVGKTMKRMLG